MSQEIEPDNIIEFRAADRANWQHDLGVMTLPELQVLEAETSDKFKEFHTDLTIIRDTIAQRFPDGRMVVIFTARQFRAIDYYLKQNGLLEPQRRTTPKTVYMTEKATGKSVTAERQNDPRGRPRPQRGLPENAPAARWQERPGKTMSDIQAPYISLNDE